MRRSSLFLSFSVAAMLGACANSTDRDRYPVFFAAGSTELSSVAHQIIGRAAQDARDSHASVVEVVGHAAAHGTNLSADEQLAMDRAKAVADALATDGVGTAKIKQFARAPSNNQDAAVAARRVSIEIDPGTP